MTDLSPTDWLVLGVLATGATHGFAVATALDKEGDLGRIWAVKRPMVYQSASKLVAAGLVIEGEVERGDGGPARTPLKVTDTGRRVLAAWLHEPVTRLREMRPLLLVKIALLKRLEDDAEPLIVAQRRVLADTLAQVDRSVDDVDLMIDSWRRHAAEAAVAFLDETVS